MRRTSIQLADGRELIYFDESDSARRELTDHRHLQPLSTESEVRYDALAGEWVIVASHRQDRTHLPSLEHCPLCPSREGRLTEIPAADYDVVVFENRFPSLTPTAASQAGHVTPLTPRGPGLGRCEVVCFTSDHNASLGRLGQARIRLVVDVWADRSRELSLLPFVEQVMPFENRGEQIGVTLHHPHGQIYAYPFLAPRTARQLDMARDHRRRSGSCLFCAQVAVEEESGERVVSCADGWVGFVPAAARWPYEMHLYPRRHVADLQSLDDRERDGLATMLADALRRLDGLFEEPVPYVLACQQAPVRADRELAHVHFELTSPQRARNKLKYLAGSETAAGVFINDVRPELAAERLRGVRLD